MVLLTNVNHLANQTFIRIKNSPQLKKHCKQEKYQVYLKNKVLVKKMKIL